MPYQYTWDEVDQACVDCDEEGGVNARCTTCGHEVWTEPDAVKDPCPKTGCNGTITSPLAERGLI